jgi:hypothetical protein
MTKFPDFCHLVPSQEFIASSLKIKPQSRRAHREKRSFFFTGVIFLFSVVGYDI